MHLFIKSLFDNLLVYLCNERVNIECLLWNTLQNMAFEIGVEVEDTKYPSKDHCDQYFPKSHGHLSSRFDDQNQKILSENLNRYMSIKKEIFNGFRRLKRMYPETDLQLISPQWYPDNKRWYSRKYHEVYQPLPKWYTNQLNGNGNYIVDEAKPFSWITRNTGFKKTIKGSATTYQSWLM